MAFLLVFSASPPFLGRVVLMGSYLPGFGAMVWRGEENAKKFSGPANRIVVVPSQLKRANETRLIAELTEPIP
ncbi:hypothetical protein [Roseovarius sp.]|uniref:hypothetical protein n=1 Tax=Roseovarius sp. TaxID=1486281 RepID=UPI003D114437